MPENSRDLTASVEKNISGPDFFGLYKSEISELLSQDDSLLPFPRQASQLSGNPNEVGREKGSTKKSCQTRDNNNASTSSASLFSNGIGALLSESKKERLNSLLRQSVFTLTQEIDEMEKPVLSVCRIQSCLRCKEKLLSSDASTSKADQQHPQKKAKVVPPCSDLESEHIQLDDDMRIILEHDSSRVEELMESHTSEIFATLDHMEKKLEELLNAVMTSCRTMTIQEKQQLRKLIQILPARNLDRVVEIIELKNTSENYFCEELNRDLDGLDNVTLWRLYFYVVAVQAAIAT